jgi:GR25 family glycosyltransferase involved in LPS biosynthesis
MKINFQLIVAEQIVTYPSFLNKNIELSKFGCATSHLWCIQNAIQHCYPHFVIFEDDIIFHKEFNEIFQNIAENIEQYDLFMLGAIDFNLKKNNPQFHSIYIPKHRILGAHANIYSLAFAKDFYQYKMINEFKEFDIDYIYFYHKFHFAISYPNLVITELTTSNLNHNFNIYPKTCNYRFNSQVLNNFFVFSNYHYITIEFLTFYQEQQHKIKKDNMEQIIQQFITFKKNENKTNEDKLNIYKFNLSQNNFTIDDLNSILSYSIKLPLF